MCFGNLCTDLNSDVTNCGTCGNPCLTGYTCQSGTCIQPGQGCSTGYYKNHRKSYADGPLPFSCLSKYTRITKISQALNLQGGGCLALIRQAATAYLNATNATINYPFDAGTVISMTTTALCNGSCSATANTFDAANNLGCPLS